MLIIYRKNDGRVVGNSGTNSYLPEGPPFEAEVQNVLAMYGGTPEDYGEFRLHDERDAATVQAIFSAGSYELVFDEHGRPVGVMTHPRIQVVEARITAHVGDEVTITAIVPADTRDSEVRFVVEDDENPIVEPIVSGHASHSFVFVDPGRYYIRVESDTHGSAVVEVVVEDA